MEFFPRLLVTYKLLVQLIFRRDGALKKDFFWIIVIYRSGCRADANEAAVILLPSNITVFTLDFSGSGLSDGDYVSLGWHEVCAWSTWVHWLSKFDEWSCFLMVFLYIILLNPWQKDDLKIVVSYLRGEKRISRVGLWGRSMGAVTRCFIFCQFWSYCIFSHFQSFCILKLDVFQSPCSWVFWNACYLDGACQNFMLFLPTKSIDTNSFTSMLGLLYLWITLSCFLPLLCNAAFFMAQKIRQ